MLIDYQSPENHAAMRGGLPSAIRPTLLEEARSDWEKHPRYAGKARFFMNIHRQLLEGTHQTARTLEALLDTPPLDVAMTMGNSNLIAGTKHLINFAHGHHGIEDHGYFPQFERLYPGMDRAFALLDGDHKVLDEALQGAESGLETLTQTGISTDAIADLYKNIRALEKIMGRHIADEEEIIILIFLRHG
jgi:hemerythrin-like domain-containing protein